MLFYAQSEVVYAEKSDASPASFTTWLYLSLLLSLDCQLLKGKQNRDTASPHVIQDLVLKS